MQCAEGTLAGAAARKRGSCVTAVGLPACRSGAGRICACRGGRGGCAAAGCLEPGVNAVLAGLCQRAQACRGGAGQGWTSKTSEKQGMRSQSPSQLDARSLPAEGAVRPANSIPPAPMCSQNSSSIHHSCSSSQAQMSLLTHPTPPQPQLLLPHPWCASPAAATAGRRSRLAALPARP